MSYNPMLIITIEESVKKGISKARAQRERKARRDDIIGSIVACTYALLIGSVVVAVVVTALDFNLI